jgi:hypothetical protein
MNAFEGMRQGPGRLSPSELARQQERAQAQKDAQAKIASFKETINESGILDKIESAKTTFEGIVTGLGSGVQTALNVLKTLNGSKQPGWVQIALEYYANHPKTKLVILEKFGLRPSEQELANGTAEGLVKAIEDIAKKMYPNDQKALETLAKTFAGEGGIASLKDLQTKAQSELVAQQKEKAKDTAQTAAPAAAPAATQPAANAPAAQPAAGTSTTNTNSTPTPNTSAPKTA